MILFSQPPLPESKRDYEEVLELELERVRVKKELKNCIGRLDDLIDELANGVDDTRTDCDGGLHTSSD